MKQKSLFEVEKSIGQDKEETLMTLPNRTRKQQKHERKPKMSDRPIKDKNGTMLINQADQMKQRAQEHFREMLNHPPPVTQLKSKSHLIWIQGNKQD